MLTLPTSVRADAVQHEGALAQWRGPHGGLPPLAQVEPATFVADYRAALERYSAELQAIARNPAPADFANTVAALDRAGRDFRRLDAILQIFATAGSTPQWMAAQGELAPMRDALLQTSLSDPALFSRVGAVRDRLPASAPSAEAIRLVELTYGAMQQAGAGLPDAGRRRLAEIDARLAELLTRFNQNLQREAESRFVLVKDEARLSGLPEAERNTARALAAARGMPDAWLFPIKRPTVWMVQTHALDRRLRQELWQMWMARGAQTGPFDNRPITSAILAARQEKADLLGFPTFAHLALAPRMLSTPDQVLALLQSNWRAVLAAETARVRELSSLAAQDGVTELKPWDRVHYLNRLAKDRFAFDPADLEGYFALPAVRDALFAAATDTYGYRFERIDGVATVDPGVDVYLASADARPLGVIYLDLRPRPGKQPGSWTIEYRKAGDGDAEALPVVGMYSSPPAARPGEEILLPFDYANVLFHEFGHVLHMISSKAQYRGTGSLAVPWDFVEVPSLLNERWLLTDRTLDRLPHMKTGQTMPAVLRNKVRAWRQWERVFSANPEFLATALVDQDLHRAAADGPVDVQAVERQALAAIGMPASVDPSMRAPHAGHIFSRNYAAGVYTYLWSDILAADLAGKFEHAERGFHDPDAGRQYLSDILSRGAIRPVEQSYRAFMGRDPAPDALLRRFGLATPRPKAPGSP